MRRWISLVVVVLAVAACKKAEKQQPQPAKPAATPEAKAASVSGWIDADPAKPLAAQLADEAAAAVKAGKKPHAYLRADWCDPCVQIEKTKGDPKMQAAFAGTHIISIDTDKVEQAQIEAAGMQVRVLPIFYRLDDKGKPTGATIDGGAWGDNVPDNMAPPLTAFFAK